MTLALAAALLAACAAKKPPSTAEAGPPLEGKSKMAYIFDPANPALSLPADVKFMRPLPRETLALPKYPERALAANDGPHREVVRIVIDPKGSVVEVLDSPMEPSDGGVFAADYRHAVEETVRTWRYSSGAMLHVRDGEDKDGDGRADYTITTAIDPVAVYYDVRFTFEIVDGQGRVRTGP